MKQISDFDSPATAAPLVHLQPRKKPQQSRSVATVEAIYDATIQVLLRNGPERLTTVHVARRAGVSVGTLYQYFPNKQALLFAVLERHMLRTVKAVEEACAANQHEPLSTMVNALVNRFIDAKLADRDTSVALYRIAAEAGGDQIVKRTRKRYEAAVTAMFETAKLPATADIPFMVHMIYLTMAGTMRGHLENVVPQRTTKKLREHLVLLVLAYCNAM
jgi:AcrR family transcriptional regulator